MSGQVEPAFFRSATWLVGGFLIWAVGFLAAYVFAALACARGFAHMEMFGVGVVVLVVAAVHVATLLAGAMVILWAWRTPSRPETGAFIPQVAALVAALALVALVWNVFPIFLMPVCPSVPP